MAKRYRVAVGGSSWSVGPCGEFGTIRECRKFAESYGTTADYAYIYSGRSDDPVAMHRRNMEGGGTDWYKANV